MRDGGERIENATINQKTLTFGNRSEDGSSETLLNGKWNNQTREFDISPFLVKRPLTEQLKAVSGGIICAGAEKENSV